MQEIRGAVGTEVTNRLVSMAPGTNAICSVAGLNILHWMWAVVHPQVLIIAEVGLRPPAGEPCLIELGAVML